MEKAAFAYWENRIAPVFDTARHIHVVEIESGRITGESLEILPEMTPGAKALRLTELGIGALICGAISGIMHDLVEAYGIQVVSFVAGDTKEVIQAWLSGGIHDGLFIMPGCGKLDRHRHRGMHSSGQDGGHVMNKNGGLAGLGNRSGQCRGRNRKL
jgi:predicted Fe-Mo cluster-binding NifX family protein